MKKDVIIQLIIVALGAAAGSIAIRFWQYEAPNSAKAVGLPVPKQPVGSSAS